MTTEAVTVSYQDNTHSCTYIAVNMHLKLLYVCIVFAPILLFINYTHVLSLQHLKFAPITMNVRTAVLLSTILNSVSVHQDMLCRTSLIAMVGWVHVCVDASGFR